MLDCETRPEEEGQGGFDAGQGEELSPVKGGQGRTGRDLEESAAVVAFSAAAFIVVFTVARFLS